MGWAPHGASNSAPQACSSLLCSVGLPEKGPWAWSHQGWGWGQVHILPGPEGPGRGIRDKGVSLLLGLLSSLMKQLGLAIRALAHLGTGETQAPVTFSPRGLDWGWEPPAWRPVSCQEDVLSSRPALRPPPSLRGLQGQQWGCGGGGDLEASRLRPHWWVLSPVCPPGSLLPWTRMQGTEAPSPAPGVFQDTLQFPPRGGGMAAPGNKGPGRRGEVGSRARKRRL